MGATILTPSQIAEFHERGFVTVPRIAPAAEVAGLLPVFQRLFAEQVGRAEGAQYDMLGYDEDEPGAEQSPTIINPVDFASELRNTTYRVNALHIARQLLGQKAILSFEQAILKPPRVGGPTPWHQDEAYRYDPNFIYNCVSIWMPLLDATVDNGCMHYLPGSHRLGVLTHRTVNDDPKIHALECAGGFEATTAVPVPLPAGGAVIHGARTLHYAGPNRSEGPRYAYIMSFEIPPKPIAVPREFRWNADKRVAHEERKRRWRLRGGVLVEVWRKFRRGIWTSPGQVAFEVRRAMRALLRR